MVLIAEDEESNFLYLEALFGQYDCEVFSAKNGIQAVELFKSIADLDFIMMDIKMPLMNGLDAMIEIRKIDEKIPIVAQTAYAMEDDKRLAAEAGCDYYLSKPISAKHLKEIVAMIIS